MPFQVSPGVLVTERDLTTVVPNVATSIGAIAGTSVKNIIEMDIIFAISRPL